MEKFKNILKILKIYEKIYSYSVSRNYATQLKDVLAGFFIKFERQEGSIKILCILLEFPQKFGSSILLTTIMVHKL